MNQKRRSFTEQGQWFVELPSAEILEMRGSDGLDLLQRISTNDLMKMEFGSWAQTILTNEKGRMIDLLWVGRVQKDLLYIASGSPTLSKTKEWIEKFIIMEDVQISSSRDAYGHLVIAGEINLTLDGFFMEYEEQWGMTGLRHVVVDRNGLQSLLEKIDEHGVQRWSVEEYDDYRILEGIPMVGHEITDEFNPLEAGLERFISWNKGCYVGQEVIARLDTYKKVRNRLVRFALSGRVTAQPARIISSGNEVGTLTSATQREPFSGLGYVGVKQTESKEAMLITDGKDHIQVTVKD